MLRRTSKRIKAVVSFQAEEGSEVRVGRILTGRLVKPKELVGLVRDGLPVSTIELVGKRLGVRRAEVLLPIVGMSRRTYDRRRKLKQALTPIESDRLYRLAKIEAHAESVFGDQSTANDWLQSPNRALGFTPLELLDTEAGTGQVAGVLTRIEHGVYS